jgi:uncharacterized protein (DUF1684 family)
VPEIIGSLPAERFRSGDSHTPALAIVTFDRYMAVRRQSYGGNAQRASAVSAEVDDAEQAVRGGSAEWTVSDELDLLDWRRTIFELYAAIRAAADTEAAWRRWRDERERLFRAHPQSPIPAERRGAFQGCSYFDYDPAARVLADISALPPEQREIVTSTGVSFAFTRFARAAFELYGERCSLELYWLDAYGGGLFIPFGDDTSGETTYPAGRYLLDTVKGADLGSDDGRLVLDFNFAYNPSCAYDPSWVCPLAPSANWLPLAVRAGEQTP